MLQACFRRPVVILSFAALVLSSAATRPIRQLHQSATSLNGSIISKSGLSSTWTDWSWSMQKMLGAENADNLYCVKLDPFGALSLKSEHVFTAEDKVLQLSLRKPDIGSPPLNDLRIQLEGCTIGSDGYSVTASKTVEEAVHSSFSSEVSDQLLQQIDAGNEVNLAIPLKQFNSGDSKGCTYNRITIGRCIKALMENKPCEIRDDEIGNQISLCIDGMALTQAI